MYRTSAQPQVQLSCLYSVQYFFETRTTVISPAKKHLVLGELVCILVYCTNSEANVKSPTVPDCTMYSVHCTLFLPSNFRPTVIHGTNYSVTEENHTAGWSYSVYYPWMRLSQHSSIGVGRHDSWLSSQSLSSIEQKASGAGQEIHRLE